MTLTKKGIILSTFLWMVCSLFSQAQTDIWAEIANMRKLYTSLSDYSAELNYKIYAGHTSQEVVETQSGEIQIFGTNCRTVLGDLEFVKNDDFIIQVNKEDQELNILKTSQESTTPLMPFSDFKTMDQALQKNKAVSKKTSNGISIITFDMTSMASEFDKVTVHVANGSQLRKVILFYKSSIQEYDVPGDYKPRVEIDYVKQNFSAGFTKAFFSEKKYFSVVNGRIVTTNPFKDFTIFENP